MAVIYEYGHYNPLGLLRLFSQQTKEVVSDVNKMQQDYTKISASISGIQTTFRMFDTKLNEHRMRLKQAIRFAQSCSDASKLTDIEELKEARNLIVQKRR